MDGEEGEGSKIGREGKLEKIARTTQRREEEGKGARPTPCLPPP